MSRPNAAVALVVQDSYYKEIHIDLPTIIEDLGVELGWTSQSVTSFPDRQNHGPYPQQSRKVPFFRGDERGLGGIRDLVGVDVKIVASNMTVADYCEELVTSKTTVNASYQRSHKVWPKAARSFLIESVLLDFPIPKLALHQVTDRISRKTTREIIDGQQRSYAFESSMRGS